MSETKRPPGRPPVGPSLTTKVDPDLLEMLRERAARRETSLSATVRDVLRLGLAHDDREERATA